MLPKLPKLPSAGQDGCFWQHYCHPQVRAAIFFRTIFSKQIKQKIKQIEQSKIYKKNTNSRCA